jgi:Lipase (class 3)
MAERFRVPDKILKNLKEYEEGDRSDHLTPCAFPGPEVLFEYSREIYEKSSTLASSSSLVDYLINKFDHLFIHNEWDMLFETETPFKTRLLLNRSKWQLLLVFKGTSTPRDIQSVINNILLNRADNTVSALFTLGEELRKFMCSFKHMPHLIVTGHSLGGFYAQVLTYTIANMHAHEGEAQKSKQPHRGVHPHTVVYDSPSCFRTIGKISDENPRTVASIWMDVTNFITEPNCINESIYQGPHIGLILRAEVEHLDSWEKWKLFYSHRLDYFSKANFKELKQVVNIWRYHCVPYDRSTKLCTAFSMEEWDCLKLAKIVLGNSFSEEGLPTYFISHDVVKVLDENDENCTNFVPLARRLIAKHVFQLSLKSIQYKNIKELFNFNIKEGIFQTPEYSLAENFVDKFSNLDDGSCVIFKGTEDDKMLLVKLMSNSIVDLFPALTKHLKNANYSQLPKSATLLVVLDQHESKLFRPIDCLAKVLYLCKPGQLDKEPNGVIFQEPLTMRDLSRNSQVAFREYSVPFLGNQVSVSQIFTEEALCNLSLWAVLNFRRDAPTKQKVIHEAKISTECGTQMNVTGLAKHLIKNFHGNQIQLIKSGPGTGKSWLLRRLREELQQQNSSSWVVALDLRMRQHKLTSSMTDKAVDAFIETALETDEGTLQRQLFREKLKAKTVTPAATSTMFTCRSRVKTSTLFDT